MSTIQTIRFSEHFNLGKLQAELDFVDIPLDTDIRLYVDPYGISLETDEWFVECNNLIVDFFEQLIGAIKSGNRTRATHILSNLHEPNSTHLGLSRGRPSGRGIGQLQSDQLYDQLSQSKAVQSGRLTDLSECELLIPNIGS